LFKEDAAQLTWLSANPGVFLFDPKFEDIVLYEKVSVAARNTRINLNDREAFAGLLAMSTTAFNHSLDSLLALAAADDKITVLKAYHDWMAFNKSNESVRLYIESLARKSIYFTVESDSVAYKLYKQYLLNAINSPHEVVRAHTVYQLCLLLAQEGKKYKDFDDGFSRWRPGLPLPFSAQYQYLPASAFTLYQQHKTLMDKYPVFKQVLEVMTKQVMAKTLRVEMSNYILPGEAIPFKVTYKNTDTLYYRVLKMKAGEPEGKAIVTATADLIKRPVALSGTFAPPLPADNNVHATHLKLAALPPGRYRVLMSYKPLNKPNDTLTNIHINVTGILAINADERIYVLNRKTGYPLVGAGVKAYKKTKPVIKGVAAEVSPDGYINIGKRAADNLVISYKKDTIRYAINLNTNKLSGSSNVDVTKFYDDNINMEVFTDRGIYRPGQTVQCKVILLTKHPKTGQVILVNQQNLGADGLKKLQKRWRDNKKDQIVLYDNFGKKIDSAKLTINEFGSFAGSFVLPKTIATGNGVISGKLKTSYSNNGVFKV
jgi:hypothetical protein